jgi:hypothetical protein
MSVHSVKGGCGFPAKSRFWDNATSMLTNLLVYPVWRYAYALGREGKPLLDFNSK